MESSCSRYNARPDWLIQGNYSLVMLPGRESIAATGRFPACKTKAKGKLLRENRMSDLEHPESEFYYLKISEFSVQLRLSWRRKRRMTQLKIF